MYTLAAPQERKITDGCACGSVGDGASHYILLRGLFCSSGRMICYLPVNKALTVGGLDDRGACCRNLRCRSPKRWVV